MTGITIIIKKTLLIEQLLILGFKDINYLPCSVLKRSLKVTHPHSADASFEVWKKSVKISTWPYTRTHSKNPGFSVPTSSSSGDEAAFESRNKPLTCTPVKLGKLQLLALKTYFCFNLHLVGCYFKDSVWSMPMKLQIQFPDTWWPLLPSAKTASILLLVIWGEMSRK